MKAADCITKFPFVGLIVIAAFGLGTFLRFAIFYSHLPLWVDEAWTGAIIHQSTLHGTIEQSMLDPNPPFYFIMMYFWTKYFGLSDSALRLPSLIFGGIAPLVVLLPSKGIQRDVRLIWCSLLALSTAGIWYAQEARCYSLAFLLATACTFAYVRLLIQPDMRTAVLWAILSCLTILTEYHSVLLVGCQGICYLVVHRERALSTWPATLVFLPAASWMVAHIPRVLQYAEQTASIFSIVEFGSIPEILSFVGADPIVVTLALVTSLFFGFLARKRGSSGECANSFLRSGAWLAAGTAAVGAMLLVATGALRPTFTVRYLMVFVPGVLLGISLLVYHCGRHSKLAPIGAILIYCIPACALLSEDNPAIGKKMLWTFEHASRELEKTGLDQLIFFLDGPLTSVLQPIQLRALGGFFFKRDGLRIPVLLGILEPGDNPNERLLAVATTPRSAILWLYDLSKPNTAAVSYPTRIEQIDCAWTCSNYGKGNVGVVACHRK